MFVVIIKLFVDTSIYRIIIESNKGSVIYVDALYLLDSNEVIDKKTVQHTALTRLLRI